MASEGLFDLREKPVAVVGAGSGIGEAIALLAARLGARVTLLDVEEEKARAVAARAGESTEAVRLDVADAAAVDAAFAALARKPDGLEVVISTPSINVRKPILAYSLEELDRVLTLNVKGSFHVLRAAGRHLTAQGRGSIVLFSSIRSQVVEPGQSVYAATKAAIVQLVRTAAAEFAPVRVNAIAPGVVDTPLTAPIKEDAAWYAAYAAKCALKRWARPEEIAAPTLFLASEAASYVTGSVLFVDGGWTAVDGRFEPPGFRS
jgi:NAD(P)-dependent dehydrogenase (short-subunit alcohol dehydrogenase family)